MQHLSSNRVLVTNIWRENAEIHELLHVDCVPNRTLFSPLPFSILPPLAVKKTVMGDWRTGPSASNVNNLWERRDDRHNDSK